MYSEVWKRFSQSSNDVPALLPCALLPKQAKQTHKNSSQKLPYNSFYLLVIQYLDDLLVLVLLDLLEEPPLELLPGQPARAGERVLVQHQVRVGTLPLRVHPVREGVHLKMMVIYW